MGALQSSLWSNHEELFPTNTANCIDGTQRAGEDLGQSDQHLVAAGDQEAIVNLLEVIDVDQPQGQRIGITGMTFQFASGQIIDGSAVKQTGQRIGQCQLL